LAQERLRAGGAVRRAGAAVGRWLQPLPWLCASPGQKMAAKMVHTCLPMTFCICVFLYEGVIYNVVFLGMILPAAGKVNFIPVFAALFNVVWLLALWSYITASCGDPGRITDAWREFVNHAQGLIVQPAMNDWQAGICTTSRKSKDVRPERAHFCSVSEFDVLRMDHFCPWIGNCVGFRNYKFFLLLAIYACLASVVAVVTALPELLECAQNLHYGGDSAVAKAAADEAAGHRLLVERGVFRLFFFVFGLLAALVAVLTSFLLSAHIPMAMQNMTTIEKCYSTSTANPYDQRSALDNLAQVMGEPGIDWFLPIHPFRPLSDGFSFRRTGEILPEGVVEAYEGDLSVDSPRHVMLTGGQGGQSTLRERLWRFRYLGTTAVSNPSRTGIASWMPFLSWASPTSSCRGPP